MPNDFYGEHSWGHAGPYTKAYATFGPQGYVGPITVTHPNGQTKVIMVEAVVAPEVGPSDQEVEAAVIAALSELGTLPALWDWKKALPWIGMGVIGLLAIIFVATLPKKK